MLTYEEADNKWDNWDGGYWGKDIYNNEIPEEEQIQFMERKSRRI